MSTTAVIESVVPDTNLFIDAIADIRDTFLTLDRDHRGALEALPAALALATEHDWKLLDYMVEVFTLFPLDAALSRLTSRFKTADDLERLRMLELVPDTDPGLHSHETADLAGILEARARRNNSTVADEFAKLHAQLQTAEMPRQSIRLWRNPSSRLVVPATRRIDASRLTPTQVRARVLAREKRRPVEIEPSQVADYVRENLFVDTEVDDQARLRRRLAELAARGIVIGNRAPRGWTPRRPGELPPRPADLASAIWDHEYCLYVADQRDHAHAVAGGATTSQEDSISWAAQRTGLRGRADRRDTFLFQGNGLDDFRTAMAPTLGWRCVSCFVERSHTDRHPIHARDNTFRSDDGLCDYCRSDNHPGLPALAAGFTFIDLATAYCRFFAEHYPDAACGLLAEVRRRAPKWLTATIDGFLLEHPELPGAPEPGAEQQSDTAAASARPRRRRERVLPTGLRQARCEGCTEYKPIHDDGFCTVCRVWLELEVPAPRVHRVPA
ncbi:hypothetical protein [Nocardia salmonicida]|uniref:hypothetical protein n=1 Tax=Nocardia salmonicida TaxID=53431 RepID=UPI002E2CE634|nr:hypothetical protein [Nocardia salmonicida]